MQVDGNPNKKSQMQVIKALMDPTRLVNGPLQHQWLSEEGSDRLFDGVGSSTLLSDATNIKLIDLLTECCHGKNGLAQARCQGAMSLGQIATHLGNLKMDRVVKSSLLNLMHHAYLCCPPAMSDESAHLTMLGLLSVDLECENDRHLMSDQTGSGPLSADMAGYLFGVLLPEIESYFLDFANLSKGGEEQMQMANSILTHIVALFGRCSEVRHKRKCSEICRIMLRSNNKLFNHVQSKSGQWHENTERIQTVYEYLLGHEEDIEDEWIGAEDEGTKKKPKTQFVKTMDRLRDNEEILQLVEVEFEEMCTFLKSIESITEESFSNCVIPFAGLISSLIALVDIGEFDLGLENSLAAVKILRKMIEMENPQSTLPASEWESEDWEDVQEQISEWQGKMTDLGCVALVMNLVGDSAETPVVMAAIDFAVTLLLGGNADVQNGFAESSSDGSARAFFAKLDALLVQSYDEMKSSAAANESEPKEQRRRSVSIITDDAEALLLPRGEDDADNDEQSLFGVKVAPEEEEEEEEEEEDDFDENKNATIVFRFMQLMCEGHNLECQKLMQKQPGNVSYDLIDRTLSIVRLLTCDMPADLDEDRFEAGCQGLDTLIELIQGACRRACLSSCSAPLPPVFRPGSVSLCLPVPR